MPLSWNEIRDRAIAFAREFGDDSSENADAQTFWNEFFNVFGVSRRRVAVFERKVPAKAAGGRGRIDLLWPGVMLAEHKSRGQDLDRAHTQAIDYFPGLAEADLPRYIVVSDFARIRIHDLEADAEFEFEIGDLHRHVEKFGFIAGYEARRFREQDPVNVKAAELLGKLHDRLQSIGYTGHQLEVYLVRILFCLFAEDTGIFMPRNAFEEFIRARTGDDGSDLASHLNELFDVLNTPPDKRLKNLDEELAAFPYVNGKLFEENLRTAHFDREMREVLLGCCGIDWALISPAVFGSLFQGIMDAEVRRNLGAHYTSEANILKVIGPAFMDDLRAEFDRVKANAARLRAFHEKLGSLQFFDPACGCGNFLVITYREIRLLELEVIKRLYGREMQQLSLHAVEQYVKVDVDQFHGIEIEEWPAQIARVAMWLIDHQMNLLVGKHFGNTLVRVPLVKSANIVHADALALDWNRVVASQRCSFIIGNPPFVGAKYMEEGQRAAAREVFGDIENAGLLDFVAAWYVKAAKYMSPNARCAFVSTNSITQGEQSGVLWPAMFGLGVSIHFAHRTFAWRNEARGVAAVHCVIIGFGRGEPAKRWIFDYADIRGEPQAIEASNINGYLVDGPNLALPKRSRPICECPRIGVGNQPIDGGNYLFTDDEMKAFVEQEPASRPWFRPWVGSREFINGQIRWCLWLGGCPPADLRKMPLVMARVDAVRRFRLSSKRAETRKLAAVPTRFPVEHLPTEPYLVLPEVSSERRPYIPFGFMKPEVMASNLVKVVTGASLFHFGVLSSQMHMAWVRAVCGRLKSDFRYSSGIVYNNYPWPQHAEQKHVAAIEAAAQAVLDARAAHGDTSLADLYDPLAMPRELVKAHAALDRAVDKAYGPDGFKPSMKSDPERVAFLFRLYGQILGVCEGGR
jgi:hypothetical protein